MRTLCVFLLTGTLIYVTACKSNNSNNDTDISSDSTSGSDSDSSISIDSDSYSDSDSDYDSQDSGSSDSDTVQSDTEILTAGVVELLPIDDFDDGTITNAVNGTWVAYDDSNEGGDSHVWPVSIFDGGVFELSSPGFGGTGYAARMTGTTGDVFGWDYVGMFTSLHPDALCPLAHPSEIDLAQFDGIQFMAKGSASPGQLVVKLPHKLDGAENNCTENPYAANSLTRYGDYETDFYTKLTDEWTLIRLPFSKFNQPSWAPSVFLSDVLTHLKELGWEYEVPNGEVDLWIDNLSFYKAAPDPSDVYPRSVLDDTQQIPLAAFANPEGSATSTDTTVSEQEFSVARRVQIISEPQMLWDVMLYGQNSTPISREDLLYLEFSARCITPPEGSDTCHTTFLFQENKSPYTHSAVVPVSIGSEWQKVTWPFLSKQSYDVNETDIGFFLGYTPQTVEFGGIKLTNLGHTAKIDDFPKTEITYDGRAPDASWRTEAMARIEQIRKGDMVISVKDANGEPVSGATIDLRQSRHQFGFGTAINAYDLKNTLTGENLNRYESSISELFNTVVLENALKWPQIDGTMGEQIGIPLAQWGIDWATQSSLSVRGHVLVWPGWSNVPSRLKREYESQLNDNGEEIARAWLQTEIETHIRQTVAHFKGQMVHWDVVNEPFDNHDLTDIVGMTGMSKWFQAAREADPDAKLFINEYSILAQKTTNSASRENLYRTVATLIDDGAPLDGIGFQAHFDEDLASPDRIYDILDQFAVFNKEIWISEFDFPKIDPALAADYTRDFLTVIFSHPSVEGMMMWGFWDGNHYGNSAPIYDDQWNEKPSGQVYRDLVFNQWHTSDTGLTTAEGMYTSRAFFGDYEITVTIGESATSRNISFAKESAGTIEITI
ncbi:MAG: endo-1,4-beta-xylanase [Deltaproteobacteria bacterium]|nr:endo-1,4-beta-xylanase [Deltaproteobacteria bacterium]